MESKSTIEGILYADPLFQAEIVAVLIFHMVFLTLLINARISPLATPLNPSLIWLLALPTLIAILSSMARLSAGYTSQFSSGISSDWSTQEYFYQAGLICAAASFLLLANVVFAVCILISLHYFPKKIPKQTTDPST